MRIIGGMYRGRTLVEFDGEKIRPTGDKTRESLFDILQFKIGGASFLDLFCGTGAVGIEAYSRGADRVVLCDNSRDSIKIAKANLAKLKIEDIEIKQADAIAYLDSTAEKFDYIFIDAPYKDNVGVVAIERAVKHLKNGGMVIYENEKPSEKTPQGAILADERKYGRAHLYFYRKEEEKEPINCVFAGSFDPITVGHEDIIEQCLKEYNKVLIVIGENSHKIPLFTEKERLEIINAVYNGNERIRVATYSEHKNDYEEFLKSQGISVYVRGIRDKKDMEYESDYKKRNAKLYPFITTKYIMASEQFINVSSSLVRDKIENGEDFSSLLSKMAYNKTKEILSGKNIANNMIQQKEKDTNKIKLLSPNGEEITLANDRVAKWYRNYKPVNLGDNYKQGQSDHFAGKRVKFSWQFDGADYFVLSIAEGGNYDNCISYKTKWHSKRVDDLKVLTDYSYKVVAYKEGKEIASAEGHFKTAKSPRTINIDNVSNTRDIAFFSDKLKQGMIYRGGMLDEITKKGKKDSLKKYGIKTDIDLRVDGEGTAGTESPLGDKVNYYTIAGAYYVETPMNVKDPVYQKNMADTIKIFADENNYPIYFHCAIGRDRTGTLAMVLEMLLGATYNDLLADYEVSFFSEGGCKDSSSPEVMYTHISALYDFLSTYKNEDKKKSPAECAQMFLLDIGVTQEEIDSIKKIMRK